MILSNIKRNRSHLYVVFCLVLIHYIAMSNGFILYCIISIKTSDCHWTSDFLLKIANFLSYLFLFYLHPVHITFKCSWYTIQNVDTRAHGPVKLFKSSVLYMCMALVIAIYTFTFGFHCLFIHLKIFEKL